MTEPKIINSLYTHVPDKPLKAVHGFVVHAISEFIHRDGLKYLPKYDKNTDQYEGIQLHTLPEWIRFDLWLHLVDLSVQTCIQPDGTIMRLLENNQKAYHAGVSIWGAYTGLNSYFLGSEIVMPGQNTYGQFVKRLETESWVSTEQYKSLAYEINEAKKLRDFPKENIIGHNQCSGDHVRGAGKGKKDPGAFFNWDKLHYYINLLK